MPTPLPTPTPRRWFVPWVLLYAVLIAYSSTIVGPSGMHYVPLEPATAWTAFLNRAFVLVNNGSDQRADWVGNLSMFVPFGFLMAGSLWPRRSRWALPLSVVAALSLSLAFLLAVKYAQLFFPPRTVNLNYVLAQACGATIGIMLFWLARARLARVTWRRDRLGRDHLRDLLGVYTIAVSAFLLLPLDFALNAEDLAVQWQRLPTIVTAVAGSDRPLIVQATVILADTLAMAPFGMLLVLGPRGRNRGVATVTLLGFGWMLGILVLSALVIGARPTLVALFYRTAGIALGAWTMRWLTRQSPDRIRQWAARLAVWAVVPYLVLLAAVNGLLSKHWYGLSDAIDNLYPLGLLPLFDYYIVSKAETAKNILGHAAMYAPIGIFVWLRGLRPSVAAILAMMLVCIVEGLRFLRPGLQGDINAVAVAGLSALAAARLMPWVWRMVEGVTLPLLAREVVSGPSWRERAAAARLRETAQAANAEQEAEHF